MQFSSMDFVFCLLVVMSLVDSGRGTVKCHDCSSWNPYCREKVDEPFESAVAAVECEKTSTCFLKKDESGVINRGCADWWMESQVDMNYVGCQTQLVPWLGEMVWCFCKQDYCNGGSIDMMANKVYPDVKQFPRDNWEDYEDWVEQKQNVVNVVDQKHWEKDPIKRSGKTFDDINPGYLGSADGKKTDPKYQLWFWHADSDRPRLEKESKGRVWEGWRAPDWVEQRDGKGWDFPVTGNVHEHTAEETTDFHKSNVDYDWTDAVTGKEDTSATTETWNWGEGWGHIKPWWLREDEEESTLEPVRWTPHPTVPARQHDDGFQRLPRKWDENSLEEGDLNGKNYLQSKENVMLEISKQEFFCWDCYSDSPLCGDMVLTQKAAYLGKTACSTTSKCFVRRDNGVIYRGCADGWASSSIDTSYVGCRSQQMWGRKVEWCFCTASLCNGDSMARISEKYEAHLEPFKASTEITVTNFTVNATIVEATNSVNKSMASENRKTTPQHLQKRSTTKNNSSTDFHVEKNNSSTDFHVEKDTKLSSSQNDTVKAVDESTKSSQSPADWQTTNTGKANNTKGLNREDRSAIETNYKALVG